MARLLTQQINLPIILRMHGWLLMIEALFMVGPLAIAFYYGETQCWQAFLGTSLVTLAVGFGMSFGIRPHRSQMRKREGLLLTATIWVVFSIFGMVPFLLTKTVGGVTDAFFEAMAGFTTTGASVVRDLDDLPKGLLFWRATMQWLGGMGIILFTLAVLPMLNYKGGIALFNAEVTGITHERLRPRVSQTAKGLWLVYVVLTFVLALLLLEPMGWFDAICHAMTTMSTGGLSTHNEGINYWHSHYVYGVVALFMFLAGINFTLLFQFCRGKVRHLLRSDTFKWYAFFTILTSVVIVARMRYMGLCDSSLNRMTFAVFDTIAAMSTGFATVDYETKGEFITGIILITMFFGGMAGSTSGGAKIDRLIVLLKNAHNEFYRVLHPNTVTAVRIDGRSVAYQAVSKVIAFLSIYMLVVVVVAVLLTLQGMPIFDAIFTSISTISNVGLGHGVTAASGAFGTLPLLSKWLLAFEMLVGRLEVFTVLVIFIKPFWVQD